MHCLTYQLANASLWQRTRLFLLLIGMDLYIQMLLRKVRDVGDWNHIQVQTAKESTFLKMKESKSTQDLENGERRKEKQLSAPMGSKRWQERVKPGPCSFVYQRYPFWGFKWITSLSEFGFKSHLLWFICAFIKLFLSVYFVPRPITDTEDSAVKVTFPVHKTLSSRGRNRWEEDNHSAAWCEKFVLERPGTFIASVCKDIRIGL